MPRRHMPGRGASIMRKGMLVLAAPVAVCSLGAAVYLFAGLSQCEYDGYFSVNVDGVSCRLNLSGITAHEMDGLVWLNLDYPILKISGQQYLIPARCRRATTPLTAPRSIPSL